MSKPLSAPTAAPAAVPASSPGRSPYSLTLMATTPPRATTEPTERSMPPVMITKVMPSATRPYLAVSPVKLLRLKPVAKFSP